MAGTVDTFLAEEQLGKEFSNRVQSNLLQSIRRQTLKQTGKALKTKVKPSYKDGMLDRITITTPYYIYPILHTGFEGKKKKGVNMRLKALHFLTEAVENGALVEALATKIGENRAYAITAKINLAKTKTHE